MTKPIEDKANYRILFKDGLNAEPVKPALTLNKEVLLEPNEMMTFVGAPGVGKSQLIEGMVYSFVSKRLGLPINNKYSFGFIFSDEVVKGRVLHIDTERTTSDINNSFKRLDKRFGGISELDSFYTLNSQNICTQQQNTSVLESELKDGKENGEPYSVIFLDGILDFNITNKDVMMDAEGGIKTIKHINKLATEYNCIVICTIHPNPESEKASGHIGSSLQKWSRCMLMLREKPSFKDVFEITAKFKQAKQSHGKPIEDVYYLWDDTKGFNIAVPFVDIENRKSKVGRKVKIQPFEWYDTKDICIHLVNEAIPGEPLNKTELRDILTYKIQEGTDSQVNSGRDAVNSFIEYLIEKGYLICEKAHKNKLYSCKKIVKPKEYIQTTID